MKNLFKKKCFDLWILMDQRLQIIKEYWTHYQALGVLKRYSVITTTTFQKEMPENKEIKPINLSKNVFSCGSIPLQMVGFGLLTSKISVPHLSAEFPSQS